MKTKEANRCGGRQVPKDNVFWGRVAYWIKVL